MQADPAPACPVDAEDAGALRARRAEAQAVLDRITCAVPDTSTMMER